MRTVPKARPSEVRLETGTVLVGDVHLDLSPRASEAAVLERERFLTWLAGLEAPRLVVVGDLFDAWVGPAHGRLPAGREATAALRALTDRGVALDVLHGNRDFLLDASFERETGARVHPAGLLGRPVDAAQRAGSAWLVLHGDELCTRDRGYQRLKRVLRSAPVRGAAPRLPGPVARWVAARLRRASVRAVAAKPPEAKTQQVGAARAQLDRHGAGLLVCGHAHRYSDEALGTRGRWIVLDAFGGPRDQLRVGADGRPEVGRALGGDPPDPAGPDGE